MRFGHDRLEVCDVCRMRRGKMRLKDLFKFNSLKAVVDSQSLEIFVSTNTARQQLIEQRIRLRSASDVTVPAGLPLVSRMTASTCQDEPTR